jgi:adenylylsulfate kinase-like enzyme
MRRAIELSEQQFDWSNFVFVALIVSFASDRKIAREKTCNDHFIEVYLNMHLSIHLERNRKGYIKKYV